jgi:hypothetical protein
LKEGLHIDYNGTKIDSYKVNGKTVEDCCSHEIWNGQFIMVPLDL